MTKFKFSNFNLLVWDTQVCRIKLKFILILFMCGGCTSLISPPPIKTQVNVAIRVFKVGRKWKEKEVSIPETVAQVGTPNPRVAAWGEKDNGAGQERYLKTGICSLKSHGKPLLKALLSSNFKSLRSTTAGFCLSTSGLGILCKYSFRAATSLWQSLTDEV